VHEFAIAQSICRVALEEARRLVASEIVSVTCRIGVLRQVVSECIQTAFEIASESTPLERATLKVETEGIEVSCRECGTAHTVYEVPFECPACRSVAISCKGGQDLTLVAIEVN
jgi:hydrogenase nickel incorporation protein HypA/HybF